MQIGSERVSGTQKNLLARCKKGPSAQRLIESLMQLVRDGDIRSGEEDVHPDWIELFASRKELLQQVLPESMFSTLEEFFGGLSQYDPLFAELNPSDLTTTFVLGAGASKPRPSDIPTVKELLPQLLERARRLDREDVTKLADFCEERKFDNIEDLLTAAQLATFCSRSPIVLRLMNFLLYRRDTEQDDVEWAYRETFLPSSFRVRREQRIGSADVSTVAFLQDTLQVLFGLLASTMLPAKPNAAHMAIADYAKQTSGRTSVVTTNYDCCIDLALGDAGVSSVYGIPFSNQGPPDSEVEEATPLIKLHGSLNWYYCETCQEVQLVDLRHMLQQYADDRAPYPVIGICKSCGGQRRGLLVPPLAMKFDVAPPLTPLLEQAKKAFGKADAIVVVGFSFAEADVYISRMISKSMQMRPEQKLVVVDPHADVAARIRRKFKSSIPGFDESRILRLSGDCAELLPKFLSGDIRDGLRKASKEGDEPVQRHVRRRRTKKS